MTPDVETLRGWCGSTRESRDEIAPGPVAALSAALDCDAPAAGLGEPLPPCWHWLFFHEHIRASDIGVDGHPRRGDFLPPVPLPRRMWAAGQVNFHAPVRVGDALRRVSTVTDVRAKSGRSGVLVFVTVNHQYFRKELLCMDERQDLVYREADAVTVAASSVVQQAPEFDAMREFVPDEVLLFRYSALTYNSHRIHYDRDYAMRHEGYPALVVQGPLTATLLLDLLRRDCGVDAIRSFEFRGRRPLFDGATLSLCARCDAQGVELEAREASGAIAMSARASFDNPDA